MIDEDIVSITCMLRSMDIEDFTLGIDILCSSELDNLTMEQANSLIHALIDTKYRIVIRDGMYAYMPEVQKLITTIGAIRARKARWCPQAP